MSFNFIAPFNKTGYGVAASSIAAGLIRNNITEFKYDVIGELPRADDPDYASPEYQILIRDNIHRQRNINNGQDLIFWHIHDCIRQLKDRKLRPDNTILYTTFELDEVAEQESNTLNLFNRVITANPHHALLVNNFYNKVHCYYIPHGIDPLLYGDINLDLNPITTWNKDLDLNLSQETLVISSCGKFEKRKGFEELLQVLHFLKRPTLLIAYWFNPFRNPGYPIDKLISFGYKPVKSNIYNKNNSYIALMPFENSRKMMITNIAKSNIFVSPSRAEGFNLPLVEAECLGLNTLYSEIPVHNSLRLSGIPIKVKPEKERAIDLPFFNGNGTWNVIDLADLYSKLENLDKNHIPDHPARLYSTRDRFNIKVIASSIHRLLITY